MRPARYTQPTPATGGLHAAGRGGGGAAGRSVVVFGVYTFVAGLLFASIPGVLLDLLGAPPAVGPWPRVVGVIAIAVGVYHVAGGRSGSLLYLRASVLGRLLAAAGLIAVAIAEPLWQLAIFAGSEVAGATWPAVLLRRPVT